MKIIRNTGNLKVPYTDRLKQPVFLLSGLLQKLYECSFLPAIAGEQWLLEVRT